jgi:hypothetical protein
MKKTRPDFIIVGAAKSGTTSMFETLGVHPKIYTPTNKEPWFYSHVYQDLNEVDIGPRKKRVLQNYNDYVKLFEGSNDDQICGEASTVYLYDYEKTIENISKLETDWRDIKIIILLRNPVYRAFSHYMNDYITGFEKRTFSEVVNSCIEGKASRYKNYLEYGRYSSQVKSYLDNFNDVKIIVFEHLLKKNKEIVSDTFRFLGCQIDDIESYSLKKENASGRPKYPIMTSLLYKPNPLKTLFKIILPKTTRKKIAAMVRGKVLVKESITESDKESLEQYYKEDIESLEEILGYRIEEWK